MKEDLTNEIKVMVRQH